ncbi:MAG: chemotaxis protein CheA, partial [Planctomycetota bacterium]
MASEGSVPETLRGFGAVVRTVDPANRESLVEVGVRLEEVFEAVSVIGGPSFELVRASMTALVAVYEDRAADPAGTLAAVAEGLQAAEACLAKGMGRADAPVTKALTALESAVGHSDRQGDLPGPPASSDASPEPGGDALARLNTLAATLIGLEPGDADELGHIHGMLAALTRPGSLPTECARLVESAAESIRRAVEGEMEDPESALATAGESLGQAADALEARREQAADAAPDEPHAVGPQEEAPSEQAADPEPPPARKGGSPEPATADDGGRTADAVLPADTDPELLREYVVESLDHILAAEAALLEMEANSEDLELVNTVFRAFHTIKGTSGFLGLDDIGRLAHLAESLLGRARDGQATIAGAYADLALKSCDVLRAMIEPLAGLAGGEPMPLPRTYGKLLAELKDPDAAATASETDEPLLRVGDILVGAGEVRRSDVERAVREQGDKPIGQVLVEQDKADPAAVAKALRVQKKMAGAPTSEATVRVATGRLDSLFDMVGELVIAQSMVAEDPEVSNGRNIRLARSVSHAGKIVRELQDLAMALRMVPLKGTFQKMTRLVRDLARKSGKSVRLVTDGEETRIDRNMVEVLSDPLVHMIRNAVDHGAEPADERRRAGKQETCTVTLRACHAAGNVVIELADDGRGLDRERILTKAVERGLIEAGRDMSDSEVFQLIFHPGFSTAETVT